MAVRIIGAPIHAIAYLCKPMHIHAMTEYKERRQRALAELIRSEPRASQEELVERLLTLGYAVTQATISRDLDQIGAVKVRRDGQLSYAFRTKRAAAGTASRRRLPRLRPFGRAGREPRRDPDSARLRASRRCRPGRIESRPRSSARSAATIRSSSPARRPTTAGSLTAELRSALA